MTRDEALALLRANLDNDNNVKHCLATEAIMRGLADHLGEDAELWGLAGLLHDVDLELVGDDMDQHSRVGANMACEAGAPEEVAEAILSHNERHGVPRQTAMDKALFCADALSGLIVAGALVLPDKKLAALKASSLRKRYREKRFAAGVRREDIAACNELGLELERFLELGLAAMQRAAPELGL